MSRTWQEFRQDVETYVTQYGHDVTASNVVALAAWAIDHTPTDVTPPSVADFDAAMSNVDKLAELADNGIPWDAVAGYIRNAGSPHVDPDNMDDAMDQWSGEHDTVEAFAQELADDIGLTSRDEQWPHTCIDWSAAWRELRIGGDYWSDESPHGTVYVWRSY
jgi:hypothetical protein